MRSLGIPNNKNFYEVTKIDDALSLWKNIQVCRGEERESGVCVCVCVCVCERERERENTPPPPRPLQDKAKGGFHAEVDEEFEDGAGNVYNRKTYEDLKRQGLI
jgi:splicing factor 3A subunit 3